MSTVIEAPAREHVTEFVPDSDPNRQAHLVAPASLVTEAMVMGMEVTALCGHRWKPSRDPDQFPVCQGCIEVYESVLGPWDGRR